jgi:hypothetical protein
VKKGPLYDVKPRYNSGEGRQGWEIQATGRYLIRHTAYVLVAREITVPTCQDVRTDKNISNQRISNSLGMAVCVLSALTLSLDRKSQLVVSSW